MESYIEVVSSILIFISLFFQFLNPVLVSPLLKLLVNNFSIVAVNLKAVFKKFLPKQLIFGRRGQTP